MLLDSNIIIYAAQPEYSALRSFIRHKASLVSIVTYIEVLGYHRLSGRERELLEEFFQATEIAPVSNAIADRAISLRQQRRMTLGDSIIAATSLEYEKPLATHNTTDFDWVADLELVEPLLS
jgi:toxin FitB